MKKLIFTIISLFIGFSSNAQMQLKDFVNKIDWSSTESGFVYSFYHYLEPCKREIWTEENSESNFILKNISIEDFSIINSSYIRVSQYTKKLYRLNLMFMKNNDMNIEKAERIIASIYKDFGEPIKKEVERSQFIDNISTTMKWETYDYTMELYYNYSPSKGVTALVVSLEPYKF